MSDPTKMIEMRDPDLDVIMAHGGPGGGGIMDECTRVYLWGLTGLGYSSLGRGRDPAS